MLILWLQNNSQFKICFFRRDSSLIPQYSQRYFMLQLSSDRISVDRMSSHDVNPLYTWDASRGTRRLVTHCLRLRPFRKSYLALSSASLNSDPSADESGNPRHLFGGHWSSCRTSLALLLRLDGVGSLSAAVKLCDVGGQPSTVLGYPPGSNICTLI